MKRKRKICLIPYDPVELHALQAWLEGEARKGWQLKKIHGSFASFETCEPRETRYRLDVQTAEKYPVETELRQAYTDAGWEFVSEFGWFDYCVYRTDDPGAIELHTDPAVLERILRRRIRGQWIGIGLAFLVLIWLLLRPNGVIARMGGSYRMDLLTGDGVFTLASTVGLFALLLAAAIWSIRRLRQARKNLDAGEALHMDSPGLLQLCRVLFAVLFAVSAIVLPWFSVSYGDMPHQPISRCSGEIALPLWQNMNGEEYAAAQNGGPEDLPFEDFLFEKVSPFSDRIQCVRQAGDYEERENGTAWFRLFYDADYYDMKAPRYAESLFRMIMEYDDCRPIETDAGLDEAAWGNPYAGAQSLLLRAGDTVVYIHYNGGEDLRSHVDLFADAALRGEHP